MVLFCSFTSLFCFISIYITPVMNKKFICLVFMVTLLMVNNACVRKISTTELEANLKAAMARSLNTDPDIDSTKVKFTVLEVSYYEEKNTYACEFKVNMKTPNVDTTGMMSANISKNFVKILRKN
jgi:uncharacterized protein YpmS